MQSYVNETSVLAGTITNAGAASLTFGRGVKVNSVSLCVSTAISTAGICNLIKRTSTGGASLTITANRVVPISIVGDVLTIDTRGLPNTDFLPGEELHITTATMVGVATAHAQFFPNPAGSPPGAALASQSKATLLEGAIGSLKAI